MPIPVTLLDQVMSEWNVYRQPEMQHRWHSLLTSLLHRRLMHIFNLMLMEFVYWWGLLRPQRVLLVLNIRQISL